jgi:valyl-tRNA synthetase
VDQITLLEGASPEQSAAVVSGDVTIYLPLAGMVDLDAERERLKKELDSINQQIEKAEKQLANESFVSRAPAQVVEQQRARLADLTRSRTALQERLGALVK